MAVFKGPHAETLSSCATAGREDDQGSAICWWPTGIPRWRPVTDLEWSGCVGFEGQSGVSKEAVEQVGAVLDA
ncbi:hypothetical protein, partial [Micromonospora sp. NPDC003241]